MHQVDFSNLIPENTLVFCVPDKAGELHTWEVPPFSEETELAFWAWHKRMFAKRAAEQKKGMGIADEAEAAEAEEVVTKARIWAPLLAACVQNVSLDPEHLARDFQGLILQKVGAAVVDFFLTGQLPAEAMTPPSPSES